MKNIEKKLLAYYKVQTENAPVISGTEYKATAKASSVRKPWGRIAKIAIAAVLVIATLAALPLFIKNGKINGTNVLIDDTSNKESEVENTETTETTENDGEESEKNEDNESRLIPPEGVKIVYAPDTTTIIGGDSTLEDEYLSDPDYLRGIGEPYIEQNGLDSMYYVMINLYSTTEMMEKSCREYYSEYYPEDFSNGPHTFEQHLAYKQDRVNKEMALLEEYGITGLELQWPLPPGASLDDYACPGANYVGYVKGENLLKFEKTMLEYFWAHYNGGEVSGAPEFPENATGGSIYLLPEGYSAADYIFGVLSYKTPDGHWAFIHY